MTTTAPRRTGKVRLVLEVETPLVGTMDWVRLTCSIPGREGVFNRVWTTHEGRLDDGKWQDLQAAILGELAMVLDVLGGSQQQLPF